MASFISSTFTTGERKKKAITYGKLSRLPQPRPSPIDDDAPSPERPHKHPATVEGYSAMTEGHTNLAKSSADARSAATSRDEFDVPSEDEFAFQPTTPAKRPIEHGSKTKEEPRASVVKRAAVVPNHPAGVARPPQKPVVARTLKPNRGQLQDKANSTNVREKGCQTTIPSPSTTSQAKAPQFTEGANQTTKPLQRSNTSSKNTSRAASPGPFMQPASKQQSRKTATTIPKGKLAKATSTTPASPDVFDVPSDNEEASVPIPRAPSQVPRQVTKTAKAIGGSRVLSHDASQKLPDKSNDLGSLQNRKRKGSVSLAAIRKPAIADWQETSNEQRNRKVAKRKEETAPAREAAPAPHPRPLPQANVPAASANKPRRARTRTVPVVGQPTISKGQSSPAVLNRMLPVDQAAHTLREDAAAEVHASDDTMYDVPDSIKTPARPTSLRRTITSTPGSVTPRQKDLFNTLLSGSVAPKTPASALASLQLTDKKPTSLLGALARSKSDVSLSGMSRKTRILDTLKDEDTSSEEEDSENDDEVDSTINANTETDKDKTPIQAKRLIIPKANDDDLQADDTTAADSQNSQMTSGAVTRPKLTYASQRSYLQEANPEDEFLMTVDLDDGWKMDSQTVSTDDEDGPTSQPRTHHELKKYGQNTMFSWDMEESIREISKTSDRAMRRSAMMDLCTKMADAGFVSQLLDSGFMHKLLENMTLSGDGIFDFIAGASVLFVLHAKPVYAIVDQIYRSGVTTTLIGLVDKDTDILRIARDRKSNMSKIAQESLTELHALLLASRVWSSSTPERMSPQLLALQTIDILTRSLREFGSTEALLTPIEVSKLVNVCSLSSKQVEARTCSTHDLVALDLVISTLETVSIADQGYSTWPLKVLQQLSDAIPAFFRNDDLSKIVEAMKLCMHLTNNKPKSCQPFSSQTFVGPLVSFIVARFDRLDDELEPEHLQVLDELTLSLGTMINLAELSDQARLNAIADTTLIQILVTTFVVGAERAAEATSVEQSRVGVVIGFLAVLLGMLCLNTTVRSQIQDLLPDQRIRLLLESMKEFARIHKHVDKSTAGHFEGSEGQETLNNYYMRIMHVVKKLDITKA